MDVQAIFKMMRPHLDLLDSSEKKILSSLITALPPQKITCHHRKIHSLKKAKENLELACQQEMKREKTRSKLLS